MTIVKVRKGIQNEVKNTLDNASLDNKRNSKETVSYLTTPYFINETILKSDILKIEEILLEKFGNRVDKSEIPEINYINYSNFDIYRTSINSINQENKESFYLIKNNYFEANSINVIDVDKDQKHLEFEKISENTFIKKYLIPIEASIPNKNESGLKSKKLFHY